MLVRKVTRSEPGGADHTPGGLRDGAPPAASPLAPDLRGSRIDVEMITVPPRPGSLAAFGSRLPRRTVEPSGMSFDRPMPVETALIALGTVAVRTATKLWLGDHKIAAEVGGVAVDQLAS